MDCIVSFLSSIGVGETAGNSQPKLMDETSPCRKSPLTTTIYVPSHTQGGRLRMKYFSYLGIDPQQKQHMHILKRNRKLHESFFREKIAHHVEAMQNEISEALAFEAKQYYDEDNAAERDKVVSFYSQVEVIPIENISEFTQEEKESYWQNATELRDTAERNIIEFEYEEFDWEKVIEEDGMLTVNGELIHPVFM